MPIEKTIGRSAPMSLASWSSAMSGRPIGGRPLGTVPTVVMPRAAKSNM